MKGEDVISFARTWGASGPTTSCRASLVYLARPGGPETSNTQIFLKERFRDWEDWNRDKENCYGSASACQTLVNKYKAAYTTQANLINTCASTVTFGPNCAAEAASSQYTHLVNSSSNFCNAGSNFMTNNFCQSFCEATHTESCDKAWERQCMVPVAPGSLQLKYMPSAPGGDSLKCRSYLTANTSASPDLQAKASAMEEKYCSDTSLTSASALLDQDHCYGPSTSLCPLHNKSTRRGWCDNAIVRLCASIDYAHPKCSCLKPLGADAKRVLELKGLAPRRECVNTGSLGSVEQGLTANCTTLQKGYRINPDEACPSQCIVTLSNQGGVMSVNNLSCRAGGNDEDVDDPDPVADAAAGGRSWVLPAFFLLCVICCMCFSLVSSLSGGLAIAS